MKRLLILLILSLCIELNTTKSIINNTSHVFIMRIIKVDLMHISQIPSNFIKNTKFSRKFDLNSYLNQDLNARLNNNKDMHVLTQYDFFVNLTDKAIIIMHKIDEKANFYNNIFYNTLVNQIDEDNCSFVKDMGKFNEGYCLSVRYILPNFSKEDTLLEMCANTLDDKLNLINELYKKSRKECLLLSTHENNPLQLFKFTQKNSNNQSIFHINHELISSQYKEGRLTNNLSVDYTLGHSNPRIETLSKLTLIDGQSILFNNLQK